jgi:hypothetical protein
MISHNDYTAFQTGDYSHNGGLNDTKFGKGFSRKYETSISNPIKDSINECRIIAEKKGELLNHQRSQNLKRIDFLKKIHPNISYGHQYKNALPLYLTQSFDIDNVFVYVKTKEKYNYPDNAHAFDLKKITDLKIILEECKKMIGSEKKINYINKILNEN